MINSQVDIPRRHLSGDSRGLPPLGMIGRFQSDPAISGVQSDILVFCNKFEHTTIPQHIGLLVGVTNWAPDRVSVFVLDPYLECHKGIVALGRPLRHPFPGGNYESA